MSTVPPRSNSAQWAVYVRSAAILQANADVAEAQNDYGSFLLGQQHSRRRHSAGRLSSIRRFRARINLAELHRATGQNEKSEQTYAEAIAGSPDQADLSYGHALSLVRGKAMPDAIREFEMGVSLDPGNFRYRTTLAIALDSVGRTEDAFAMLDQAVTGGE